jgi:hypothetical protein
MPSPFPGMNTYLEKSVFWQGIHHLLISAIAQTLNPQLRPKYVVAVEVRTYQTSGEESLLVGIPDVVVQRSQATKNQTTDTAISTLPINQLE